MGTRVLLLRHAQSVWNEEGRWQGWADPGLSTAGRRAAEEAEVGRFDAFCSSDLRRAHETACILAQGKPVSVFRGLRERGAGQFTGLTRAEIDARWPGARRAPVADIPGGEAPGAVIARAVATLHRIGAAWPADDVLAVTHGALIRLVERHLGGDSAPLTNLTGRWVHLVAGDLRLGEPVPA